MTVPNAVPVHSLEVALYKGLVTAETLLCTRVFEGYGERSGEDGRKKAIEDALENVDVHAQVHAIAKGCAFLLTGPFSHSLAASNGTFRVSLLREYFYVLPEEVDDAGISKQA